MHEHSHKSWSINTRIFSQLTYVRINGSLTFSILQAERKLQNDDLEDRLEDLENQNEELTGQCTELESKFDEVYPISARSHFHYNQIKRVCQLRARHTLNLGFSPGSSLTPHDTLITIHDSLFIIGSDFCSFGLYIIYTL